MSNNNDKNLSLVREELTIMLFAGEYSQTQRQNGEGLIVEATLFTHRGNKVIFRSFMGGFTLYTFFE